MLWVTVPVNADGPSLALSVLAVAFALRYRADPRLRTAVWMGLAAGGAVSIKALSVPALVIAGLIVLLSNAELRTGVRDAAIAAGIAVVRLRRGRAARSASATCGDQSYSYHQERAGACRHDGRVPQAASRRCGTATSSCWSRSRWPRSCGSSASSCAARAGRPGDRALTIVVGFLVLWVVLLVALLVWEPAMWRAHVAHLVPPLALLAALKPPSWKVLLVAGVVTVPFAIASNTSILWPDGYTGQQAALVRHLETFPSDARFISDDPGLVWRSGHDTPGDFADTSYQRLDDHSITAGVVGEGGLGARRVRRDRDVTAALRSPRRPPRRARRARLPPDAVRRPHHALRARHRLLHALTHVSGPTHLGRCDCPSGRTSATVAPRRSRARTRTAPRRR